MQLRREITAGGFANFMGLNLLCRTLAVGDDANDIKMITAAGLRVLQHSEKSGNARKACRYFGVGRSTK